MESDLVGDAAVAPDLALLPCDHVHLAERHHGVGEVGAEGAHVRVGAHLAFRKRILEHALVRREQPQLVDDVFEVLWVELRRGYQVQVHQRAHDAGHGALFFQLRGEVRG